MKVELKETDVGSVAVYVDGERLLSSTSAERAATFGTPPLAAKLLEWGEFSGVGSATTYASGRLTQALLEYRESKAPEAHPAVQHVRNGGYALSKLKRCWGPEELEYLQLAFGNDTEYLDSLVLLHPADPPADQ